MLRKGALAVAIMVLSGIAIAQEEAEEGPWSGDLSLGYLSTSGNTDTTNYKTSFGIGYTRNDWEHRFKASSNGAVDTDETTAESYQMGWRSTYNFTEKDFAFGTVDWRKDRFAGVTEQLSYALNYGRTVIDTPKHQSVLAALRTAGLSPKNPALIRRSLSNQDLIIRMWNRSAPFAQTWLVILLWLSRTRSSTTLMYRLTVKIPTNLAPSQ
jgi:hypothetical protein